MITFNSWYIHWYFQLGLGLGLRLGLGLGLKLRLVGFCKTNRLTLIHLSENETFNYNHWIIKLNNINIMIYSLICSLPSLTPRDQLWFFSSDYETFTYNQRVIKLNHIYIMIYSLIFSVRVRFRVRVRFGTRVRVKVSLFPLIYSLLSDWITQVWYFSGLRNYQTTSLIIKIY